MAHCFTVEVSGLWPVWAILIVTWILIIEIDLDLLI